jgi:small GTP-binding protein
MLLSTSKASDKTLVKLLIVGDSSVGKSCLLARFVDDSFNTSFVATIGIDFRIRLLELDGVFVKLQVWDTAGQERFRSITAAFYRGAMGVILAYDSTNSPSFETLPSWMEMIRVRAVPDVCLMLVATKCDMVEEQVVSAEQGSAFCR